MAAEVVKRYGRLDILVDGVGGGVAGWITKRLDPVDGGLAIVKDRPGR